MVGKPQRIVDIHNHLVPAVDDGASSFAESVKMLETASKSGVTDMIVTPHYQRGRFYTPPEKLEKHLERLQKYCIDNNLGITLYPGTEIYYHSELETRLEQKKIVTMNNSSFVLVEFNPMETYTYIRNAVDDIMGMGLTPILAHVERYQCMLEDKSHELLRILKSMGCLIQCNTGSVEGKFGFKVKQFLHSLLKEQLIDFIGTDAHSCKGRRTTDLSGCIKRLYKKYDSEYVDSIVYQNAVQYLIEKED